MPRDEPNPILICLTAMRVLVMAAATITCFVIIARLNECENCVALTNTKDKWCHAVLSTESLADHEFTLFRLESTNSRTFKVVDAGKGPARVSVNVTVPTALSGTSEALLLESDECKLFVERRGDQYVFRDAKENGFAPFPMPYCREGSDSAKATFQDPDLGQSAAFFTWGTIMWFFFKSAYLVLDLVGLPPLVMILPYVFFNVYPNLLIMPLQTLRPHENCPHLLALEMEPNMYLVANISLSLIVGAGIPAGLIAACTGGKVDDDLAMLGVIPLGGAALMIGTSWATVTGVYFMRKAFWIIPGIDLSIAFNFDYSEYSIVQVVCAFRVLSFLFFLLDMAALVVKVVKKMSDQD